jgi:hypothetical protein
MGCTASPTISGQITSRYGVRQGRTTGRPTFHAGWDMRGAIGDPVFAAADGVVESIVNNDGTGQSIREDFNPRAFRGYGNVVVLTHPHLGTWTSYNHLNQKLVVPGQLVRAGSLIATVGNSTTGKFPGMGAHLHFEVRHATRDHQSPFPGAYGQLNLDPADWFRQHGTQESRPGVLAVQEGPCEPDGDERTMASFWQDAGSRSMKAPEGSEYEPPVHKQPVSAGAVVGVVAAGAALWWLLSKKSPLGHLETLLKYERETAAKRFVSVEYCDYHGTNKEYCWEAWRGTLLDFLVPNEDDLTSDEIREYIAMKPGDVISGGGGAMIRYKVRRMR